MSYINISNLRIHLVIKALWNNMKPASFYQFSGMPSPQEPSDDEIDRELSSRRGYIDYIAGRCIKIDFSDLTKIDPRLYDRDAGEGAFKRIISEL